MLLRLVENRRLHGVYILKTRDGYRVSDPSSIVDMSNYESHCDAEEIHQVFGKSQLYPSDQRALLLAWEIYINNPSRYVLGVSLIDLSHEKFPVRRIDSSGLCAGYCYSWTHAGKIRRTIKTESSRRK